VKFPVQSPDDNAAAGGGAGGAGGAAAAGGAGDTKGGGAGGAAGQGQGDKGGAGQGAGAGAGGAGDSGKGGGAGAGAQSAVAGKGDGAADAAGKGAPGAGDQGTPNWGPDHWRATYAGADDKKKAFVERYTDPAAAIDAAFAAREKIEALTVAAKKVLPENATPEQIAQYRKDNGIPEKPEGYFDALPKDVRESLDDEDKQILSPYLAELQNMNIPPAAAAKLVALRQAELTRFMDERTTNDNTLKVKVEDELRKDWGNNYRAEINNVNAFLSTLPPAVQEALHSARTPDGVALFNSPVMLKAWAQMARTVNPYSIPIGNDGGSLDEKGVEGRIAEIERWMGAAAGSADYKRYYGDPKISGRGGEYETLLDARANMKKRNAA
jgi:hypothetical protein